MTRLAGARLSFWLLAAVVSACGTPDDRSELRSVAQYTSPIVLLVSPDSSEVEDLRAEGGEDFYVAADDAMWYRSLTYELLDSLGLRHADVGRGQAEFMVEQKGELVSWEAIPYSWFAVVYDGKNEPIFVPDVDIRGALAGTTSP